MGDQSIPADFDYVRLNVNVTASLQPRNISCLCDRSNTDGLRIPLRTAFKLSSERSNNEFLSSLQSDCFQTFVRRDRFRLSRKMRNVSSPVVQGPEEPSVDLFTMRIVCEKTSPLVDGRNVGLYAIWSRNLVLEDYAKSPRIRLSRGISSLERRKVEGLELRQRL